MMLPNERVLELYKIIKTGTEKEARQADEELEEIAKKEMEERKKNPPPCGDLML